LSSYNEERLTKTEATMAVQQPGELTLDDLKQMIAEEVARQLQISTPKPTRTVQEVNESLRPHHLPFPPGRLSVRKMLRENLDQHAHMSSERETIENSI
jgi:hypothetical protein